MASQGGIDEGEVPREAALRELTEETNITSARIVAEIDSWLVYDFPLSFRERWAGTKWEKYKGQRQKWFLVHFYGRDEEIDLMGNQKEYQEFTQWKW